MLDYPEWSQTRQLGVAVMRMGLMRNYDLRKAKPDINPSPAQTSFSPVTLNHAKANDPGLIEAAGKLLLVAKKLNTCKCVKMSLKQ